MLFGEYIPNDEKNRSNISHPVRFFNWIIKGDGLIVLNKEFDGYRDKKRLREIPQIEYNQYSAEYLESEDAFNVVDLRFEGLISAEKVTRESAIAKVLSNQFEHSLKYIRQGCEYHHSTSVNQLHKFLKAVYYSVDELNDAFKFNRSSMHPEIEGCLHRLVDELRDMHVLELPMYPSGISKIPPLRSYEVFELNRASKKDIDDLLRKLKDNSCIDKSTTENQFQLAFVKNSSKRLNIPWKVPGGGGTNKRALYIFIKAMMDTEWIERIDLELDKKRYFRVIDNVFVKRDGTPLGDYSSIYSQLLKAGFKNNNASVDIVLEWIKSVHFDTSS